MLILYTFNVSPPCRSVQMLLDVLNVPHEARVVDPIKGETKRDKFIKLNPQHCVPTLQDGDLVLSESRAILMYLAHKYDSPLYPEKDPKERARVDMRLFFEMGTFFQAFAEATKPLLCNEAKEPSKAHVDRLNEVLKWVSDMVRGGFVAGTKAMTVADLAFLATYSTLRACNIVDCTKHHFIEAWFNRCKQQIPHYKEVNESGSEEFAKFYRKMKINQKS